MPPVQTPVSSYWNAANVSQQLRNLQDTVNLAKALQKELEEIHSIRQSSQNNASSSNDDVSLQIMKMLKGQRISLNVQESLSLEAACSLISTLRDQLFPSSAITNESGSWEQQSVAVRLAQKLQKAKRNKRWRKKRRKHVAELMRKEHDDYGNADQDADEWRAREIAKDIARRKVESMKAIAKLKAKEERERLESEVRRTWDAYIRPGGSRIPGHWVQPPEPADEVWASYLVASK